MEEARINVRHAIMLTESEHEAPNEMFGNKFFILEMALRMDDDQLKMFKYLWNTHSSLWDIDHLEWVVR